MPLLHAKQIMLDEPIAVFRDEPVYNETTVCGQPGPIGDKAVECQDCLDIIYSLLAVQCLA